MADALSSEQIEQLRIELTNSRTELISVLETSTESAETVELDQQLAGRVSRIDAIQQQQMAKANNQQYRVRLKQIGEALKRIQSEDYGYCQSCDEAIGYARIKARPESPLCVRCQELTER